VQAFVHCSEGRLRKIYNAAVYSAQLLDHFQNPRNPGEVAAPDALVQLQNPVCGDVLKLTAKFEGNLIADIQFLSKGLVPAMACGSAITELAKGRTVQEARTIGLTEVTRQIGGLPEASLHAVHLAVEALAKLLAR